MEALFKGLIFDLGGVLVEWNNAITYHFIEKNYGIDFDISKKELEKNLPLVQMGKLSEREWLGEFFNSQGKEPSVLDFEIWGKTFTDAKNNDNVIKIIKTLKKKGFKIAILSNIEPSRAVEIRRREFINYFDVVVFSCEVGTRKVSSIKYDGPKGEDIFKFTVKRMGLIPDECIYIDNTAECIAAAREAGLVGILFTNSRHLISDLKNYGIRI